MTIRALRKSPFAAVFVFSVLCLQIPWSALADDPGADVLPAPVGAIRFVGKNLVATADGSFSSWKFTKFDVDPEAIADSEVVVEVDISSVDTGSSARDEHLREADFFDVANFPTATVRVFGAQPIEGSPMRYTARFEIRIRDVTKTLEGEFDLESGSPSRVTGRLVIDRTDFGIGKPYSRWNPLSIKELIPIEFGAEAPS